MIAGPVGRVNAMVRGKIARIRCVLSPNESHEIQQKKATQQTVETTSDDMIVVLFHEYAAPPASWRAKTSRVDAAKRRIAPRKSTLFRVFRDTLGAFRLSSF